MLKFSLLLNVLGIAISLFGVFISQQLGLAFVLPNAFMLLVNVLLTVRTINRLKGE